MEKVKEIFQQYKWVLLASVIVAILVALITANFHVLQFMKYKLSNNVSGVIQTISVNVSSEKHQEEWYFQEGMEYLIDQEEYTDEIKTFFETNFDYFSPELQKQVIKGYSDRKLYLTMTKGFMELIVANKDDEIIQGYLKHLPLEELESGLTLIYGNAPKVTEEFVIELSSLLAHYPNQLSFNKFKFNLYNVLTLAETNSNINVQTIIAKIEPSAARENIFKDLKLEPINEKELCSWLDLFNNAGVITPQEYAQFNKIYGEICMIRKQYQGLDEEEVELQNKKNMVETKISGSLKTLEEKQKEIHALSTAIDELESKIDNLTNYIYMPLYIEEPSNTGSNEYIASVPRGGLFGLRPSSQKYILKLVDSDFVKAGVYNVNVYLQGTKATNSGAVYDYYVEASQSDLNDIEALKSDRSSKLSQQDTLQQEVNTLQAEIDQIKKENNYDENQKALESIATRREEYSTKATEKILKIKQMFGLSNITISLKEEAQ